MRLRHCRHERAVIAAAQSNDWTVSLREHIERCAVCTEVLVVEAELRRESEMLRGEIRLPPADLVWLRSRIAAQDSVLRPLHLVERWSLRLAVAGTAIVTVVLALAIGRV